MTSILLALRISLLAALAAVALGTAAQAPTPPGPGATPLPAGHAPAVGTAM